tara:strand:+ start:123 stop:518 length:396 start_codon:yes stop_codon:yes gene_type:complete
MGGPNKPRREPAHGLQLHRSSDPAVLKAKKDGLISKSDWMMNNTTSLKAMMKRRAPKAGEKVPRFTSNRFKPKNFKEKVAPKKKVVAPKKKIVKKTVPKTSSTTGNARRTPSGVTGVSTRKSARGKGTTPK